MVADRLAAAPVAAAASASPRHTAKLPAATKLSASGRAMSSGRGDPKPTPSKDLLLSAVAFARAFDGKLSLGPNNSKITGGGTAYRLDCPKGTFFLKVQDPVQATKIHAEAVAAAWAGDQGYGPKVLEGPNHLQHIIATQWLESPSLTPSQAQNPRIFLPIFAQLKALHSESQPNFLTFSSKNPAAASQDLAKMKQQGVRLQLPLTEMSRRLATIHRDIKVDSRRKVWCHGDFWAPNVHLRALSDGLSSQGPSEVFFVDWEKTGIGDAFEDIGMYCAHAYFSPKMVYQALAAYLGHRPSFAQCRQVRLYMDSVDLNWYVYQACDGNEQGALRYLRKIRENRDLYAWHQPILGRFKLLGWRAADAFERRQHTVNHAVGLPDSR